MLLNILDRAEWGALPPKRVSGVVNVSQLKGLVIHYLGIPNMSRAHSGCERILQGVQKAHMNNIEEGYVDIAYNHAVCPHGFAYQLRGFYVRSGANGTSQANTDYNSIVYLAGKGDPFTGEAKHTMALLIAEYRRQKCGKKVLCHGDITGSECPGPAVRAWVRAGSYEAKKVKRIVRKIARPRMILGYVIKQRLHKGRYITTVEPERCC